MDIHIRKSFFVLVGLMPLVYAQDQQSLDQPSQAVIEEVIVTGQKMEQDLQEVMDSISVISGEDIEKAGIEDFRDALLMISNVNSAPTNNSNSGFVIRGINSEGVGEAGGNSLPTASLVIDGAVQSVEGVRKGAKGVWDLSSVEVLRGPQITLGRNALAGAINIKTKDPELGVFDSSARAVFSTQGHEQAVFVNIPIYNDLSLRLAGEKHSKDINIDYAEPRLDFLGEGEFESIRTKLLYEPSFLPDFSAKLTFSTAEDSPPVTAVSLNGDQFSRALSQSFGNVEQRVNDVDNWILDLNYDISDTLSLTSVSTLTKTNTKFITPNPLYDRQETRRDKDFSQDLRLHYRSDNGSVNGLVAVFIGNYKNNVDSTITLKNVRQKVATKKIIKEIEVDKEVTAASCVNLDFLPDNGSRFYTHVGGSFHEIGRGINNDGLLPFGPYDTDQWRKSGKYILTSERPPIPTFFNYGADWKNLGTITVNNSSLTGVNLEEAQIVTGDFNVGKYAGNNNPSTIHSNNLTVVPISNNGTANYENGVLQFMEAEFTSIFDFGNVFGIDAKMDGKINLYKDGTFKLLAGKPEATLYSNILAEFAAGTVTPNDAYAWDFTGKYSLSADENCSVPSTALTRKDPVTGKIYRKTEVEEAVYESKDFIFQNFYGDSVRKNKSIYSQVDWMINQRLKLIAGARFEKETYRYTQLNRQNNRYDVDDTKYNEFLPKLGLMFNFTPEQSIGMVVTKGYRGGFVERKPLLRADITNNRGQLIAQDNIREGDSVIKDIQPESLIDYEWVYRGEWFDRRLITNVNFFLYDWSDQQVTTVDLNNPLVTEVKNAGESKIYGTELSINSMPLESLIVGASFGYLKTELKKFGIFSGKEFPQSPRHNAALIVNYSNFNGWFLGADMNYLAESFSTLNNSEDQKVKARTLFNARLGYENPEKYRITLDFNNLTNKKYLTGKSVDGYIGNERVISLSTQFWWN